MGIKELEQYRALRQEIKELERRIVDLTTEDVFSVDVVQTTEKEPPFITHASKVVGFLTDTPKIKALVRVYQARLKTAGALLLKIEQFINGIEDSEMRQIIQRRYVDGMPWRAIPEALGLEGSGTTQLKQVRRYLRNLVQFPNVSTNSTK